MGGKGRGLVRRKMVVLLLKRSKSRPGHLPPEAHVPSQTYTLQAYDRSDLFALLLFPVNAIYALSAIGMPNYVCGQSPRSALGSGVRESFYGSPPRLFFNEMTGFKTSTTRCIY